MFYVDYIEPGQPKKAPFVLRTHNQLSVFFKDNQNLKFEKGSVNILMEKDSKSCEFE